MSDLSEVTEQLCSLADEQRARWEAAEARLRAAQGTPHWDDVTALLAELDNARDEREVAQRHHLRAIGERDALAAKNEALRRALATCAECAYLPCDQTLQCGCCGVAYWTQAEEVDENWHADGCALFAAEVLLSKSRDVRRGPAPEGCHPWVDPASRETAVKIRAEFGAAKEAAEQWRRDYEHKSEEWAESNAIEAKRADDAEVTVRFLKEREDYFAKALRVADGGQYRADWPGAMERLIRDRDTAKAAHDRLVRAIADRKGALESVAPERVRAYLTGHGWTMHKAMTTGTGFPMEVWRHRTGGEAVLPTTKEPADYANCIGYVARACGQAEKRDMAFVIAEWLDDAAELESGR